MLLPTQINYIFQYVKYCGFLLLGLQVVFVVLPLLITLSVPVFIYRLIICKVLAPRFRPDLDKAVSVNGSPMASEFLQSSLHLPPRCSIVTCFVMEGTVPMKEMVEQIHNSWIYATDEQTGELMYPELQQFICQWMGYMFWKKDNSFHLDNHVFLHEIDKNGSPNDSKQFLDQLIESLVNKPYDPRRSPWDFHLIHNYRDPELLQNTKETKMTAMLLRCHHSMADGFSILSLLTEGLLGATFSSCKIAQPAKFRAKNKLATFLHTVKDLVKFPFQLCHDTGYVLAPIFMEKNPWHIQDSRKSWIQLYGRSSLIPLKQIKDIKNCQGVSFTAVLLSSISAGVIQSFKSKGYKGSMKSLPLGTAIPLPNHPKNLSIHVTGTLLDISIDAQLNSEERLHETERNLKAARQSLLPLIGPFLQKLVSIHVTPVARYLIYNWVISTGMSNFPGPGVQMKYKWRKVLTTHFAAGAVMGVAGVGFMILSYNGHIQIAVTAEKAVLSKTELEALINKIVKEIDKLHKISSKSMKLDKNLNDNEK